MPSKIHISTRVTLDTVDMKDPTVRRWEKEKDGIVSFTIELALFSPANQDFIHTFCYHHSYLKPQDTILFAFLCEFTLSVIPYCMQE